MRSVLDADRKMIEDLVEKIKITYPNESSDFIIGYLKGMLLETVKMTYGSDCEEKTRKFIKEHKPLMIHGEIL